MTYPENSIQGWMTIDELRWLHQEAVASRSVVEVGAWAGRSTHALLTGCKGLVTVVDTWLEPIMGFDNQAARLGFCSNTEGFGNLSIIEKDSLRAARTFKKGSVDMVFLDANHGYAGVLADLKVWTPKTSRLICGHDYSKNWPGVVQAVNEFFGGKHEVFGAIWFVRV